MGYVFLYFQNLLTFYVLNSKLVIEVIMETKEKSFFTKFKEGAVKLWNYYTTYEKCWLFGICSLAIVLGIVFADPESAVWLTVVEIIAVLGGCSCELLLSKQSRWAFIVSFIFYDTTQTIVYFANGFYVSALFEILFWIPMLFISFYVWTKHKDDKTAYLTQVRAVNIKRDLTIFCVALLISVGVGLLFTQISLISEGLSDWWYLDALANTFSVCNGIFLLFRFREQWVPWICVAIIEAIMWILSGQYAMLVLSLGYLMNSTYGFIRWTKYAKATKNQAQLRSDRMSEAQNWQSTNPNGSTE